MSPDDGTAPKVWVQTRRRIDFMMSASLIAVGIVATWVSWPAVWKPLLILPVVAYPWLVLRHAIPKEGRVYPRTRVEHEHKRMAVIASVALPSVLATLAVDWLGLPHPVWFYAGIYAVFFGLMLGLLGRLDRAYGLSTKSNAMTLEHDAQVTD